MIRVSPVFLIPLAVSALLGMIGGGSFRWAGEPQAWNIFTAAFLWTLISAAGTTIGRFAGERLRRGAWGQGLRLAAIQSFPLTTSFLLISLLLGAPLAPAVGVVLYSCTLVIALFVAILGVMTSPYLK